MFMTPLLVYCWLLVGIFLFVCLFVCQQGCVGSYFLRNAEGIYRWVGHGLGTRGFDFGPPDSCQIKEEVVNVVSENGTAGIFFRM